MESTLIKSLHHFQFPLHKINSINPNPQFFTYLHFKTFPLQASRRISSFPQGGDDLIGDFRNWSRRQSNTVTGKYRYEDDDYEDDEEEEDEDRSIDLLVKFVQSVFKKVSRKAKKAIRSVLPVSISSELVAFSVNGFIILTFLWLLKAVLEVFCTLGSVVFASILLVRGVWTCISYLQNIRNDRTDNDDRHAWSGAQPAS